MDFHRGKGIFMTLDQYENLNQKRNAQRAKKKVAAYCRVSTAQEEQLNSYDVQVRYYTEKIRSEPKWAFVGIFADRGLSGTSTKKRDEFNKMIKLCKRGKIDMIAASLFLQSWLDSHETQQER